MSELPKIFDFDIIAGDDHTKIFTWKDSNGALVDITGYSAILTMKSDLAGSADLTINSGTEITIGDALGTVTCLFPKAKTALTAGKYFYDLQLTDTATLVTTLVTGIITIQPGVSS